MMRTLFLLILAGCSSVSVTSSDPKARFADERVNVVENGTLSKRTRQFLFLNNISTIEQVERHLRTTRERGSSSNTHSWPSSRKTAR